MQASEMDETGIDNLKSKISNILTEGCTFIKDDVARKWFIRKMKELKQLAVEIGDAFESATKKAGKMRVSLMYEYGEVKLLVNGEEIDIPDRLNEDDEDKEIVHLYKIFKTCCEDMGGSMINGEKVLDEREIKKIVDWIGHYWDEIYEILGID